MKKIAILLLLILALGADCAKTKKKKAESQEFLSAKYAVLMDFETGECLFSKDANKKCAPSSMTKLMTAYLLFSRITNGSVSLNDELQVSELAQKMPGSRSFFKAGSSARVEDLIRSIAVHSGNDACIIVAEGLAGDVDAFVAEMNEKAKEFKLKDTNFVNPTGLPDENHFSSVHDLAVISRRLISDFPQFYHYFGEKTFRINEITQQNRNILLGNSLGVDGIKTGKTKSGGLGISVSAKDGGKRLIAVINGCESVKARAKDANKLLAFGFREFISFRIAEAGKPIATAKVWLGVKDQVELCTHEDVMASAPRKYGNLLRAEVRLREPINAPVVLGAKLGELVYVCGNYASQKYDLFPCESVERVGFLKRAIASLKYLIFGNETSPQDTKIPLSIQNKSENGGGK
ncbi:MAG: D-alanyl-D-alanine carboxypeptidase [Holosporaceae bacterium]|jgi:D-alanyl-D-alanine carboxypeptidase (penicillin-binding protein 5/6)|nr:D-alanyl-D-alanine carboxypeptidase [Holosporaceae bacterium]